MCQYCSVREEGWTQLLTYDDVYQRAVGSGGDDEYGFHESWDDLRDQLA
ncbi:hypothetical protein [Haladaptatus sp. DYF46]|nr:hypothetical protein [Haladaptatus sp. DYF46]